MKKLIVTGADGFVAGSVIRQAGGEWQVHALSLSEVAYQRDGLFWYVFDLRDSEKLKSVFAEVKPDAVIHTAAMADIDFCENNKDIAEAVNIGVTREIAALCEGIGAKMVLLSTDTVFDGTKGLYTEEDEPVPINFYAGTKVKAEKIVSTTVSKYTVTRLSLVMGLPVIGSGNSFMAKMITSLEEGKQVGFPENEIRTPVDVITLGRALLELAGNDYNGFMHLSSNTKLTRYAMAQRIAERLGFPVELVKVKNSEASPGRAPRPVDASLSNAKAKSVLKTTMQSLDGGIDLVLAARKGEF